MLTPHTSYSSGEKVKMGITVLIQELENIAFRKTLEQSICILLEVRDWMDCNLLSALGLKLYEKLCSPCYRCQLPTL